jgi:hypothetical protein
MMAIEGNRNYADDIIQMIQDDTNSVIRPRAESALGLRFRRIREQYRKSIEHLFDLLPAAWDLEDREFEQLLQVPPGWLAAYRNHELKPNEDVWGRLQRLFALYEAMRMAVRPRGYSEWLRQPWRSDSPIGPRSPLKAILEDGDSALDLVEKLCRTQ